MERATERAARFAEVRQRASMRCPARLTAAAGVATVEPVAAAAAAAAGPLAATWPVMGCRPGFGRRKIQDVWIFNIFKVATFGNGSKLWVE